MSQFSPGNHFVPRCLKMMFPGTTSSVAPFLAPKRLPGPCVPLLARPSDVWEALREKIGVRKGFRVEVGFGMRKGKVESERI